jgi:hypothetical protein
MRKDGVKILKRRPFSKGEVPTSFKAIHVGLRNEQFILMDL